MKKLDQRGVAALEFCLVALPLFILMFVIFDLGRYAITVQSLQMLVNAEARANMIKCYTPAVVNNQPPSNCTGAYLSVAEKQDAAPYLYVDGLTTTVMKTVVIENTAAGTKELTVTASLPEFPMSVPMIWGALGTPKASTSIPFR